MWGNLEKNDSHCTRIESIDFKEVIIKISNNILKEDTDSEFFKSFIANVTTVISEDFVFLPYPMCLY